MSLTEVAPDKEELNQLLSRTGLGDRAAFAELYRRTSPRLLGVCVRMLVDRREAEEVLQDAYVTVWQRGKSFDPSRARAIAWLVALARNKAIDRLRQRRNAPGGGHGSGLESIADEEP